MKTKEDLKVGSIILYTVNKDNDYSSYYPLRVCIITKIEYDEGYYYLNGFHDIGNRFTLDYVSPNRILCI